MVNANSTSQLHPATVLDDVTETEFVGGSDVKKEGEGEGGRFTGDGRPSPNGRDRRPSSNGRNGAISPNGRPSPDGRPSPNGRVQEGRSRLVGGRREEGMREMVVD